MVPRTRIIPNPPPTFPTLPGWARPPASGEPVDGAGFLAGAALAALDPIARHQHPLGSLWRQRLALQSAAGVVRLIGRAEDEAALRDACYLTRPGDDPGPAGRILIAWRALGAPLAARPGTWQANLATPLALKPDPVTEGVFDAAERLATSAGDPLTAAAEIAALTLKRRPEASALALWLADAVLGRHLRWPVPVPLLASRLRRADLRLAQEALDGEGRWRVSVGLAYARAAAAATDLFADLARRADRLLAVAPKLRGKDADRMLAILLMEDAQPAKTGQAASDRSSRRLFGRLVALGGARELTGRASFRLYGL